MINPQTTVQTLCLWCRSSFWLGYDVRTQPTWSTRHHSVP